MIHDSRLSAALHALLHMAEHPGPMTSEALAACMGTNPAVVRRTMAGLRDVGLVRSSKGHGGGWTLDRPLGAISLRDVFDALGTPRVFAIGNKTEHPDCLLERAVNAAVNDALRQADAVLLRRLEQVSLAAIAATIPRFPSERAAAPAGATHAA